MGWRNRKGKEERVYIKIGGGVGGEGVKEAVSPPLLTRSATDLFMVEFKRFIDKLSSALCWYMHEPGHPSRHV